MPAKKKRPVEPTLSLPSNGQLTQEHIFNVFRVHIEPGPPAKRPAGNKKRTSASSGCVRDALHVIEAHQKSEKQLDIMIAQEMGEDPKSRLRDEGQRTGLRNLGATCYMNSLLQCLFMNQTFRRGIYQWQPDPTHDCEVLKQLQRLFAFLQLSDEGCYNPSCLTEALQLNTAVQQDVQEFNKLL